jgi:hypothetical protein
MWGRDDTACLLHVDAYNSLGQRFSDSEVERAHQFVLCWDDLTLLSFHSVSLGKEAPTWSRAFSCEPNKREIQKRTTKSAVIWRGSPHPWLFPIEFATCHACLALASASLPDICEPTCREHQGIVPCHKPIVRFHASYPTTFSHYKQVETSTSTHWPIKKQEGQDLELLWHTSNAMFNCYLLTLFNGGGYGSFFILRKFPLFFSRSLYLLP